MASSSSQEVTEADAAMDEQDVAPMPPPPPPPQPRKRWSREHKTIQDCAERAARVGAIGGGEQLRSVREQRAHLEVRPRGNTSIW